MSVDTLAQVAMPTALALGKLGPAAAILGFLAATFGAAMETALSTSGPWLLEHLARYVLPRRTERVPWRELRHAYPGRHERRGE